MRAGGLKLNCTEARVSMQHNNKSTSCVELHRENRHLTLLHRNFSAQKTFAQPNAHGSYLEKQQRENGSGGRRADGRCAPQESVRMRGAMTPQFHENRTHARLAASLRMRDLMRKYKQTTTRRKAEIETELGCVVSWRIQWCDVTRDVTVTIGQVTQSHRNLP